MKYKLTDETKDFNGIKLHRIEALESFGDVRKGDKGGWIEKEANLSQGGNAWVTGDARVTGDAWVFRNARVDGHAWVTGDAVVSGHAWVTGNAWVTGDAVVSGHAWVTGNAWVTGDARIDKKIKLTSGYFYRTKPKSEKIEMVDTYDDGYETLACNPKIEKWEE